MMKPLLALLMYAILLAGCGKKPDFALSSFASFNAKENKDLKGEVAFLGSVDKSITVEGTPTSPFLITVGVSVKKDSASHSAIAEILFESKDGKLSPLMDWQMSGGGERPVLRRESDNEITVYYPTVIKEQRTWVKFKVMKK
jgi:hypothetical protein